MTAHLVRSADPKTKGAKGVPGDPRRPYRASCDRCGWLSGPLARKAAEIQRDAHVCPEGTPEEPRRPVVDGSHIEESKTPLSSILAGRSALKKRRG